MRHLYKIFALSLFLAFLAQCSYSQAPRLKPISEEQTQLQLKRNYESAQRNITNNDANVIVAPAQPYTPSPDAICATFTGTLSAADPTLSGQRMTRDGNVSTCALPKATCPGLFGAAGNSYQTFTFVNPTTSAQCITAILTNNGTNQPFVSAHLGSFVPSNICTNYLADPGLSPAAALSVPFSFTLPASATVVFVVNTVNPGSYTSFTLTVDGVCGIVPPCSGIPNPGNTVSTANPVCSGVNFTLSTQNTTTGSGVTYQWQSSPNGVSYTNIAGGTSATLSRTQTAATYYRVNVTCGANTTASNPLLVNMAAATSCYCAAGGTSTAFEKISRVIYNTINNPSTSTAGYEDFTAISTTVSQGAILPITVNVSTPFTTDQVIVFIDFNQNGSFADPGETVFTSTLPLVAGTTTGTISIPFTALPGSTRMRVRMHDTGSNPANATSCGFSAYGQVEDYTVNILLVPACSGVPNPGNTIATPGSVCAGVNFTLSLQNNTPGAGVTYQWQSSPNGVTYTNIIGAINPSYTTSQTVATYYRSNVTCGSNTTGSNPVLVNMNSFLTCYCSAGATNTNPIFEKISRVQFNTINNPSTSAAGYEDFTGISTTVGSGTTVPITVTISNAYNTDQVLVWIDFNHNGSFTDPGEMVYTSLLGVGPHTGNISIPGTALPGITRMRIRLHDTVFGPNPTPCGNSTYGQVEDYTINIQCTAANITTQPANTSICSGGSASISIAASGTGLTYKWQVSTDGGLTFNNINDGATYSGTTTNTLIINGATPSFNGYQYRVVINGTCTPPNTLSGVAILSVSTPPTITSQPSNVSTCATNNASFTVGTAGTSIFIQWQVSTDGGNTFTNIPGANSPTLQLSSVTFAMNGYKYRAIVNGQAPCVAAVSNVVTLTVFPLPSISIEADPYTKLFPGLKTTLTATVTPPSASNLVEWYRNGFLVPGARGNIYVVDVDGLGTYTAKVTDANNCTVTSNSILIGDSASGKVFIYPSPNNGRFQIRYYSAPGNTLSRSLVIYNALGEKVMSRVADVTGAYGKVDVDLRNRGKGIYWVELWVGNTRLAHGKVLVQ